MRFLFYIVSSQPKTNSAVLFLYRLAVSLLNDGNIVYFYSPDRRVIDYIRSKIVSEVDSDKLGGIGFFHDNYTLVTFYLNILAPNFKRLVSLFNCFEGQYPVDFIITNDPFNSLQLSFAVGYLATVRKSRMMENAPILCIEPNYNEKWVVNEKAIKFKKLLAPICGQYVLLSPNELSMCLQDSAYYFGNQNLNFAPIFKNISGVNIRELDGYLKNNDKEYWKVFWGGRLKWAKNINFINEVFGIFRAYNKNVDVIITTPSLTNPPGFQFFKNIRVGYGVDREKFLVMASEGKGVSLIASHIEGFPIGFFEMIYLGNLPVFLKKDWIKGITPDGYPFIAQNKTESLALIEYLVKNESEYNKWISVWRDFIKKICGENIFDDYKKIIKNVCEQYFWDEKTLMKRSKFEPIIDFFKTSRFNNDVFSLKELEDQVRLRASSELFRFSRSGGQGALKFPNRYEVYYFLKNVVKLEEKFRWDKVEFVFNQEKINQFLNLLKENED